MTADPPPRDVAGDQLSIAIEHLSDARYTAGEVGDDPAQAVAEIDAAVQLLTVARELLTAEQARRAVES